MHMKKITVLAPMYNEQEVLPALHQRLDAIAKTLKKYNFEFLFVNDGSRDHTLAALQELAAKDSRVSYINLSRNFGKEIAMIAGIDHAEGDATVIIDADLQDPPELIPEMITLWEDGYDDVYAKRKSRAGESWFKKKTSEWFYSLLQRSTDIPIQRDTGDFRLLDKRCVLALREFREKQRYTKGMFSWIGYRKKEILYDRDPRAAGDTKWNYYKLANFAIDGITSFTTAPLRLSTYIGLFVSLGALVSAFILVISTLLYGNPVAGYPSLMVVVLFLGGVQLISLGIIGEYIGRIFNETKQRPLYLIEHHHESKHAKKPSKKARS